MNEYSVISSDKCYGGKLNSIRREAGGSHFSGEETLSVIWRGSSILPGKEQRREFCGTRDRIHQALWWTQPRPWGPPPSHPKCSWWLSAVESISSSFLSLSPFPQSLLPNSNGLLTSLCVSAPERPVRRTRGSHYYHPNAYLIEHLSCWKFFSGVLLLSNKFPDICHGALGIWDFCLCSVLPQLW